MDSEPRDWSLYFCRDSNALNPKESRLPFGAFLHPRCVMRSPPNEWTFGAHPIRGVPPRSPPLGDLFRRGARPPV